MTQADNQPYVNPAQSADYVRAKTVEQIALWLASAAGEDRPSTLTFGDAADCLDGLLADGLVRLGEEP